jgi:hypothetical protein
VFSQGACPQRTSYLVIWFDWFSYYRDTLDDPSCYQQRAFPTTPPPKIPSGIIYQRSATLGVSYNSASPPKIAPTGAAAQVRFCG